MCYQTKCKSCGKATWAGCGAHKESALGGVAEESRCPGWKTGKCPGPQAGAPAQAPAQGKQGGK